MGVRNLMFAIERDTLERREKRNCFFVMNLRVWCWSYGDAESCSGEEWPRRKITRGEGILVAWVTILKTLCIR